MHNIHNIHIHIIYICHRYVKIEPSYTQKGCNIWTNYESSFFTLSMVTQVSTKLIDYRWLPFTYLLHRLNKLPQPTVPLLLFRRDLETWKPQVERILSYVFCTPAGHPSSGEFLGCVGPNTREFRPRAEPVQSINLSRTQQRLLTIFQMLD